jgi:ribonuclease P protein component
VNTRPAVTSLRGKKAFASVMNAPFAGSAGPIRVKVVPNHSHQLRTGLSVRGAKGAVVRNRLRRQLRAALRPHFLQMSGYDVVVIANAQAQNQRYAELAKNAVAAWQRALVRVRAPRLSTHFEHANAKP